MVHAPPHKHRATNPPPTPGPKLKQIQYRSYKHDISIYHFSASYISVRSLRSLLRRKEHGYVGILLGVDYPGYYKAVIEGDEVPDGCLEVGYLVNVFQHGGSAVGFCVGGNVVEWLCFEMDVKGRILDKIDVDVGGQAEKKLFDYVGVKGKGIATMRVRGADLEHRAWYDSLFRAERPRAVLRLSWKTFGEEARREYERKGRAFASQKLGMDGMMEVDEDYSWDEGGCNKVVGVIEARRRQRTAIYQDPDGGINNTPARKPAFKHSHISLRESVLSDRNTNTLRMQLSSTTEKRNREG